MTEETVTFALRASTVADLAAVDALLARSYPKLLKADYPPSILVLAVPHIARAQPRLLRCGTYYVAEAGDQIVAAGGWTRDRTERRRGHIRHVVTDFRYVRMGIGTALIQHTLDTARRAGIRQMECASTRTAVPFYKQLGFAEIGLIEVPLANGIRFPSIRMTQAL